MVHILATDKSHVFTVKQSWLFLSKLNYKKTALGIANIHKNHSSYSISDVLSMSKGIFSCQTDPIVNKRNR